MRDILYCIASTMQEIELNCVDMMRVRAQSQEGFERQSLTMMKRWELGLDCLYILGDKAQPHDRDDIGDVLNLVTCVNVRLR